MTEARADREETPVVNDGEDTLAQPQPSRWLGPRPWRRCCGVLSCCLFLMLALLASLIAGLVLVYAIFLRVPDASYMQSGMAGVPENPTLVSRNLDGFDSPYIGHTGSWDGKGGGMFGSSKVPDLDHEVSLGLRWTFMATYWCVLEPDGPVDLSEPVPAPWQALDAFVVAAQERGLNILMQAPVIGGNAGGPPDWAGRREEGRSAPANMDAAAAFAGKLVRRYRPGGTLAKREGWNDNYGVLAWELDNEPESYLTNWRHQAGDYAEFVTKVGASIREADPQAIILSPGTAGGSHGAHWTEEALGLHGLVGSPAYLSERETYSIGPWTDVVSFHVYEGLGTFLSGEDTTIDRVAAELIAPFMKWREAQSSTSNAPWPYWHTEGNFDFLGISSDELRAAWRFQFFARGFAAGVGKIVVMDAYDQEAVAVRTFIRVLPQPFPMRVASHELEVVEGTVEAFLHDDGDAPEEGKVWVIWAKNGTSGAQVNLPVWHDEVKIHHADGTTETRATESRTLSLDLPGGEDISPPFLIEDRP